MFCLGLGGPVGERALAGLPDPGTRSGHANIRKAPSRTRTAASAASRRARPSPGRSRRRPCGGSPTGSTTRRAAASATAPRARASSSTWRPRPARPNLALAPAALRVETATCVERQPQAIASGKCGLWLIPLAPADQDLVRGGLESDGEAEETLEGGGRRAASIEAEHELVEVGLEVLPAQPVVDTEAPPLGVREHPVHPGQHEVGRRVADHLRLVLDVRERGVPGPAVADDGAARDDVAGDEGAERGGRVVLDPRQPDPPRALALDLDRARDQELALVRAARPDRLVLAAKGDRGLVDLDQAGERLAFGVDHRPAELAQEQPGGLVAAEPELEPELPGGDAVPVRGHQPRRQEPELERQVAAVQHRAGGHRGLPVAPRALHEQRAPAQLPSLVVPAAGAAEPVGPALLEQPAGAGRVVGELRLERRRRARPVNHRHLPPRPARPQPVATPVSTGQAVLIVIRGAQPGSTCERRSPTTQFNLRELTADPPANSYPRGGRGTCLPGGA